MLNLNCYAARRGNKYFRDGEFLESSFIRMGNFTIPQAVINTCRRLHLSKSTFTGFLVLHEPAHS